jgi:hypothetical protein
MKYSELYRTLKNLRDKRSGTLPSKDVGSLSSDGLVDIINEEEYKKLQDDYKSYCGYQKQQSDIRSRLNNLESRYSSLNSKISRLKWFHNSRFFRLFHTNAALSAEEQRIASMEDAYSNKEKEREDLEQSVQSLTSKIKTYNPASFSKESMALSRAEDGHYVRLNSKGHQVLDTLDRLLIRNDNTHEYGSSLLSSPRLSSVHEAVIYSTVHDRSIVPLIPDLVEKSGAYQVQPGGAVEAFFASLTYPGAVSYLIKALDHEPGKIELGSSVVDTKSYRDTEERSGTFGSEEDIYDVTYEVWATEYRTYSSVAAGARRSLAAIMEKNPELKSQIDPAIRRYDNRPQKTEVVTSTREISREYVGYNKLSGYQ